jgi:SAM-dependent methyltransferase
MRGAGSYAPRTAAKRLGGPAGLLRRPRRHLFSPRKRAIPASHGRSAPFRPTFRGTIPPTAPSRSAAAQGDDSQGYVGRDLLAMTRAVRYHRWIVGELAPYLTGSVAEVGAGSGNVAELLLGTGLGHLTAIEPSAGMFRLLRDRLAGDARATVLHGRLGELAGGFARAFDSIVYLNVLEHVEDDRAELRRAYECLRPGGHLCLFVPALSWLYGRLDAEVGHLRRYDRAGLRRIVEDAGFRTVRLRYFDAAGVLPWLLYVRLLRRELTTSTVGFYDRWFVPLTRALERRVSPPLGKNLLCIARRD